MLLTTLMYMFGALTERYVCQSINNLDRIEEVASLLHLSRVEYIQCCSLCLSVSVSLSVCLYALEFQFFVSLR